MEKLHETKELDLKKASKGIWLVKVKYTLFDGPRKQLIYK